MASSGISPSSGKREAFSLPPDASSNLNEVRVGEAKKLLSERAIWPAISKCFEVIGDPLSSGEQRLQARLVRGKALFSAGYMPAAAYDFYKVLEAEHNHSEAYSYILQIQADTGLPLTKK